MKDTAILKTDGFYWLKTGKRKTGDLDGFCISLYYEQIQIIYNCCVNSNFNVGY